MDDQRALRQLDLLIEIGEGIRLRPPGDQWMSAGGERLESRQFARWRSQSIAFARSFLRDGHAYLVQLERVTEPSLTNNQPDPQLGFTPTSRGPAIGSRPTLCKR